MLNEVTLLRTPLGLVWQMVQGEVDEISSAAAAVNLGALETRAVPALDAEEDDECPVCLETLVLNDPMRLPCKHLICNQCLQQLHRHGVNQLCPLLSSKAALWL